jgi:hypothetical protein
MRFRLLLILACLALLPCAAARAEEGGVTPVIDFNRQILTAWGLAGTPWEESVSYEEEKARAWMSALHQAYAAILSVPLMEGALVRQVLLLNPGLKGRLGVVLLTAPKTFYTVDSAGLVRCKLEVPFSGPRSLRSALYLAALRPQPMEPRSFLASWSAPFPEEKMAPLPSGRATDTTATTDETVGEPDREDSGAEPATGHPLRRLVLDLRRTTFEPSLFPRFFTEEGRLLFQEAQIPSPERFSRPMVRFSERIEDAEAGMEAGKCTFVAAHVPAGSKRDVKIGTAETEVFLHFCRQMIATPLAIREILIIHGQRVPIAGLMPKTKPKEKDKEADKTGKGSPSQPAPKR